MLRPHLPHIPHVPHHLSLRAFFSCSSLTNVDFSAVTDATYIGRFAFICCQRFRKWDFALPAALSSIGRRAFDQCTSLAELTLPATLSSIDDYSSVQFSSY